jgi:RNA polymerase sigma factor (sigma-70 family)
MTMIFPQGHTLHKLSRRPEGPGSPFNAALEQYGRLLRKHARKAARWVDYDDALQEARISLYRALSSFREDSGYTFPGFLSSVVRNRMTELWDKAQRKGITGAGDLDAGRFALRNLTVTSTDVDDAPQLPSAAPDAFDLAAGRERLDQAMGALSGKHLAAVRGVLDGREMKDIASELRITKARLSAILTEAHRLLTPGDADNAPVHPSEIDPLVEPEPIDCTTIAYRGQTKPLKEWSRELGIAYMTLYHRLERGKTVEQAFAAPVKHVSGRGIPLKYKGRTQSLAAWASELDLPTHVISARLAQGWSVAKTFATPRGDHE